MIGLELISKIKFHLKAFTNKGFYDSDGLYTIHNASFINDNKFIESYNKGADTKSWGGNPKIYWRLKVILWAANQAIDLKGDFVECGVNRGGFSKAILNHFGNSIHGKRLWMFDTYRGDFAYTSLQTHEVKKIKQKKYTYSENNESYLEEVRENFKGLPVEIIEGMIPESLKKYTSSSVAFLSIDLNSSAPEISALDYFWDKLVEGAVIILDDYTYYSHEDQYQQMTEFCKNKNINILPLPTGQGLIIK